MVLLKIIVLRISIHFQIDNDESFIRYYVERYNSQEDIYKMIYEKSNLFFTCDIDIVTSEIDSTRNTNNRKFVVFNSQNNQFFKCSIYQDSLNYIFTTVYKYPYYQE